MDGGLGTMLLLAGVVAMAAFVHGHTGFGFGIISMCTFMLLPVDLERAALIVTLNVLVIQCVLVFMARAHAKIHWRDVLVMSAGIVFGMPVGYWLLATFQHLGAFKAAAGAVFFCFGLHGLLSPRADHRLGNPVGMLLGVISGCSSGALVSGGPPVIFYLYSRAEDPREMKSTVQATFIVATVLRLVVAGVQGARFSWGILVRAGLLMPVAVMCVAFGHILSRRMKRGRFRKTAFLLLSALGLVVLIRGMLEVTTAALPDY